MPSDGIYLASMTVDDVAQVAAIEQQVYPSPWSAGAFSGEVTDNQCALYIVARLGDRVLGYAGMWVFLGEAHITTIAVHPDFQGQGLGSWLMRELMIRALGRQANRMSLEVRPSNTPALNMYRRYGFEERGLRRGYYSDTGEDAMIMWNEDIHRQLELRASERRTASQPGV